MKAFFPILIMEKWIKFVLERTFTMVGYEKLFNTFLESCKCPKITIS